MKKRRLAVPHVYILLWVLILCFALLSYIIPAGSFDMTTVGSREVIMPETFHYVDRTPVSVMQFLTAVPRGLQQSAQIIFLIFIVGGSFAVLQETKAIDAGVGRLTKALKDKAILLIPLMMTLLSLGAAAFGMSEELMVFIPIFISVMLAAGYDSITGTAIVLASSGIGFAGAFANPFTVQVAQSIAEVPALSGMWYRIIILITMLVVGILYVLRYARKVHKDPKSSPVYDIDQKRNDVIDFNHLPTFGTTEKVVLLVFFMSLVLLLLGALRFGWWLDEICGLFIGMAMVVGLVSRMGFNKFGEVFAKGMTDIAAGAIVVGFASGILVVMNDANILNTILHGASVLLGNFPASIAAIGMYIFQCLLNFLVPSGSGQAAMSMPILAPLSDMVNVTRQTACIAFQLGDGISSVLTPTAGSLMAGLALAKIPWSKWARWILPLIGLEYLIGLVFVIIAQLIALGPF